MGKINTRGLSLDSIVKKYLDEVSRYPLLSRDEEMNYGKICREYLTKYPPPPKKKGPDSDKEMTRVRLLLEKEPVRRRITKKPSEEVQFDYARKMMIQCNLRLVASMCFSFSKRSGVPVSDLIQEGNIGLLRAVEKYDERKGFKFSTYASWWIRQALIRSSYNNKPIRVPIYRVEHMNHVRKAKVELRQRLHREPTVAEIAERLSIKKVDVDKILQIPTNLVSLDMPLTHGERSSTVGDLLEDKDTPDPESALMEEEMVRRIHYFLDTQRGKGKLSQRDYNILCMRFGLTGAEPVSLETVANEYGLTRERIRQIVFRQLDVMRRQSELSLLAKD